LDEEKIIEEREKKLVKFLGKKEFWTILFVIIALILGLYIRTLPMQDHSQGPPSLFTFITFGAFNGNPGLWNIATNNWTLGPDLDPWLFTRYAKEMIETGSLPKMDSMRYVPLGFDATQELQMVSYMIVITYNLLGIFGTHNIIFAAAFMPVLLFLLTIVAFFLFVREIFIGEDEKSKIRANIISLISTFFMIVIPIFLSRTVAGIPEKESVAFFFMFASFYLLLKAWKSKKTKWYIAFAILSGIATALMGLTWGGVSYIYTTIAVATLIAFLINKVNKKETIVYSIWIITSLITILLFTSRFTIKSFVTSLDTGLATIVLIIIIIHFIIWNTRLKDFLGRIKFINETKLPKNIISLIIGVIVLLLLIIVFLGPGFIFDKINGLTKVLINPITGRWSTTVAENRQPYFQEWAREFGPTLPNLPNFPIMFWLFFIGSVVLFKSLLSKLNKNHAWILTGFFLFFLIGIIFSRYAPHPAIFDGEGMASKLLYYLSALMLMGSFVYYYIKDYKEKSFDFEKIEYQYIFLFALFVLCLFTARSAVRLIMVLGPIAPIFASYLAVRSSDKFFKIKDETEKVIWGIIAVGIVILILICIFGIPGVSAGYYQQVSGQSYNFVPTIYNQQWQKAMKWIRDETPIDAVFAHWWDYGYWVQSIGNRATVLDGGNAKVFWNYYMGRLVLTGDNQDDALELYIRLPLLAEFYRELFGFAEPRGFDTGGDKLANLDDNPIQLILDLKKQDELLHHLHILVFQLY